MVAEHKTLLDEQSVLLVSGGAKGITAECAIRIAEEARCRFILVGRSALLEAEPEWASGIQDAAQLQNSALAFFQKKGEKATPKMLQGAMGDVLSSREINSTLERIREHGGQAVYISADVTDPKRLRAMVKSAEEYVGTVTGIIHGAGSLADKLIENKKGVDFDRVVDTKIKGLHNLIHSIDTEKLRFLVLFSSVAGFFGNAGQTDYAIANELLNKSAYIIQKALPECRVICMDWGPWDSGMVSPELKKVFAERNITLLSTEKGTQTMLDELHREPRTSPQVVIGSSIHPAFEFSSFSHNRVIQRRRLNLEKNPFLDDHRIGPHAVLPATCAAAWLADACQALHPGYSLYRMMDFKVLKGITLENSDQVCEVELKRQPDEPAGERIYDVTVTGENGNKRKIFHYSSRIILAKERPSSPVHPTISELGINPDQVKDGMKLYQDGTLFHGPAFRGIREVLMLDKSKVICRIFLPELDSSVQGQFPVQSTNPFINDAVVQTLLVWTQEFYGSPCLPSRLHQLDHYRLIPFEIPVVATLKVTYHNEHAVVGDILVQEEDGREFMRFIGLEGTISKHLNRFIGKKAVNA